jgi:hypothetical protein
VSVDGGLGEAYVSNHTESGKIPISEGGSKSTHNQASKDIHNHPQLCVSLISYRNKLIAQNESMQIRGGAVG